MSPPLSHPSATNACAAIRRSWPLEQWRAVHVVAAVSGGADSVAMLRALVELKGETRGPGRLIVAHYNHRLRGEASEADARWVADLCRRLGVDCELGAAAEASDNRGEQAARDNRYAFLRTTAERIGARFVATAHTADDQVETVLLRVLRGAGVAGLGGIPEARPLGSSVSVIRPLLQTPRERLLADLAALGQTFREDASNADEAFTRNRVRHALLPLLREQFGAGVDDALRRLSEHARETQAFLAGEADRLAERAISPLGPADEPRRVAIERAALRAAAPVVAREAVKRAWRRAGWPEQAMGRQHWRRIDQFVRHAEDGSSLDLPAGVHARCDGPKVELRRI